MSDDQDQGRQWLTTEAAAELFEAFTGDQADVDDISDAITELYGTNSRGGPNTREAAEQLGVSQRTVQRWIKGEQAPSARNAPAVEDAKREATINRLQDTEFLAAHVDPATSAAISENGMSVSIGSADVQISGDRRPDRSFGKFNVPPALASQIQNAYVSGDQNALRSGVEQALRKHHIFAPVTIHELGSISLKPR